MRVNEENGQVLVRDRLLVICIYGGNWMGIGQKEIILRARRGLEVVTFHCGLGAE